MQYKDSKKNYFLQEKQTLTKLEYERVLKECLFRQKFSCENLIKILEILNFQNSEYCSKIYKIYINFEYF
jgi:hypothetical protein